MGCTGQRDNQQEATGRFESIGRDDGAKCVFGLVHRLLSLLALVVRAAFGRLAQELVLSLQNLDALLEQGDLLDEIADAVGLVRGDGDAGERGRHQEEYASEEQHVDRQAEAEELGEPEHPPGEGRCRYPRAAQYDPEQGVLRREALLSHQMEHERQEADACDEQDRSLNEGHGHLLS